MSEQRIIHYKPNAYMHETPMLECVWECDEDGIYHTRCCNAWQFETGDVNENNVRWCPFCGGRVK